MGGAIKMATKGKDLDQNQYTITFSVHFPKKMFFTYTSSVYISEYKEEC